MELNEAITLRRSIRKYISKDIDNKIIEEIINAGLLAPSAHNKQPWEIVVIKENKNIIVDIMKDYYRNNNTDISIEKTADTIDNCNTLLLIYCNNFEYFDYNLLSIGAMIENMLLKATELNIGSVWIANVCPMRDEITDQLGINPQEKVLVSAVALGYYDITPKDIKRKTTLETTTYL